MAEVISESALSQTPITNYEDIRGQLLSGDLVFCSGNYAFSKAVRWVTDSCWSHVGIVFCLNGLDRVLLLESVEDMGVRFAPLSKYIDDYQDGKPYSGSIAIARVNGLKANDMKIVAKTGLDLLTKPWGWGIVLFFILGRLLFNRIHRPESRGYLCSELVVRCFSAIGIVFKFGNKQFVSPGDIWQDPRVNFLWKIR